MNKVELLIDINVNKECINNGIQESCTFCPIALSVARVFAAIGYDMQEPDVWVEAEQIKVYIETGQFVAITPVPCRNFITDFDIGVKVEPVVFESVRFIFHGNVA